MPAASSSQCSGIRRRRSGASSSTLREIYFAGVLSLVIILMSGLFVGMVLSLQGYETLTALRRRRAARHPGRALAGARARTGGRRVCCSRAAPASAITAEIGLMKTTEQLSAMEMMAVDPIARVVAPRFWGGVISMPLLAALFSAVGIFGATSSAVPLIGIDDGAFWGQMKAGVEVWPDVTNGIIKSVVFGVAVSLIAVFEGYDAKPTAEGVSTATTRTVVISSLAILRAGLRHDRLHVPGGAMNRSAIDLWVGIFVALGLGAIAVPRAQGRQPGDARPRARLSARGAFRQHRRAQARARRSRRPGWSSAASSRYGSIPRPTRRSRRCASTVNTDSRRTRSRRSTPRASWARSTSASTRGGDPAHAQGRRQASPRRNPRWCSRS